MRRRLAVCAAVAAVLSVVPGVAAGQPSAATDETTVEGELQRLSIEMEDGTAIDLTVIVPDDGEAVRVQTEDLAEVPTGSVVAVDVVDDWAAAQDAADVDGGVDVTDVDVLEAPEGSSSTTDLSGADLAAASSIGRPVFVIVGTIAGQSTDGVTTATLASDITGSVSPYWSDSTGGAVSFTVASETAAGAYAAWGSTSTCTTTQIVAILKWSAQAAGVYPTANYGRHSVLYTPTFGTCGFAGVAHVADGGSAWINGTSGTRWAVIAHELGHTLTLGHSDSRPGCPGADGPSTACQTGAYGDAYDVMGTSIGGVGPLNGAHLDALGLLPADSTVRATSTRAVVLSPVGGLSGTRFLTFTSGGAMYYVEYRGAVGRDADLATTRKGCPLGVSSCSLTRYVPGVVVRRVDSTASGASTYLLDAGESDPDHASSDPWFVLPLGQTFVTADRAVSVTVVALTTSRAELVVTISDINPLTPFDQLVASPDFTGDRVGDLFAVDQNGELFLYGGEGSGRVGLVRTLGAGWSSLTVYAPGDWNSDRRSDLVAVDEAGRLWLYAGDGSGGLRSAIEIGHGWTPYRIVPAGDVDGDGPVDLLVIDSGGRLWLYAGKGTGAFRPRVQVGRGWNGFDLYAAGDMNRDGRVDILGVDSGGRLYFYAGRGGGSFATRVQVGRGWSGYGFASGGDFNGDRVNDLMGRDPQGRLWFYAGRSNGTFASKVQIGSGW